MIEITCIICGGKRKMFPCKADRQYCGQKCYGVSKRGRSNNRKGVRLSEELKARMRASHKTDCKCFACTKTSWNKGIKYTPEQKAKIYLGGLEKGRHLTQEKSPMWKADKVGYVALHQWVRKQLGNPSICQKCGKKEGNIDWANVSHQYLRDKSDWMQLCRKCHISYDKLNKGIGAKELFLSQGRPYV